VFVDCTAVADVRAMISPIRSAPLKRARATPRPSTNKHWGGSPNEHGCEEDRQRVDWHTSWVVVFGRVVEVKGDTWVVPFRGVCSGQGISSQDTAQCSRWGLPPPTSHGLGKSGQVERWCRLQYGRRLGRRFLRQSQSSPNTSAFMRSPWRAFAAPRSPARLDTRKVLYFSPLFVLLRAVFDLHPKSSTHRL